MPITPFHLIAAAPLKAITPRRFSWSVFCLTNILIDLEPITCFLITLEPRHMFFHTIIGATLVAFISATYGRILCESVIKIWNEEIKGNFEAKWLSSDVHISKISAWIGALLGAWSHLLLDSFIHADIKPLSPFTDNNLFLGFITITWLHSACVTLGFLGIIGILLKKHS